ncbi:unnamed protein product [Dicrocoelium dendriticum]|nr:unnamed protein product [Dicrocoelium dendriticum]
MLTCCRCRNILSDCKRMACFLVCCVIAMITGYRVHIWLKHYNKLAPKMMISAYDGLHRDLPFPMVSVCNINPTKGIDLYNPHATSPTSRGLDYELFSDAYQGRVTEDAPKEKLKVPIFHFLQRVSHRLTGMLKGCVVNHRWCSALNFTRSILPTGACYTFNGRTDDLDELQLTLDPQSYDYMIPNEGFVGFRILLHSRGDPLWTAMPGSIYAGPTFHTMLRVVSLKKVYKQHCVSQSQWARCMHQCLLESLKKRCQCEIYSCNLLNMMHCGVKMNTLLEYLPPSQCNCPNPCEHITYSVESVTQALKNPLFAHSSNTIPFRDPSAALTQANFPWLVQRDGDTSYRRRHLHENFKELTRELEEQKKEIWDGSLIQIWAFLRESNRTAFEHLRQLSRLLQSLHMDLVTVETTVAALDISDAINVFDWSKTSSAVGHNSLRLRNRLYGARRAWSALCTNNEEYIRILSRIRHLGEEFVRLFRRSVLFRDITTIPGEDFHVHLVRLFFMRVEADMDYLANQLQHNDLFSDVTMLDIQRKTQQCDPSGVGGAVQTNSDVETNGSAAPSKELLPDSQLTLTNGHENIGSLQAVLLATDSQFKQFRSAFLKLTLENQELIETISADRLKHKTVVGSDQSYVTVTIEKTRDRNRLVRLESVQAIYNPFTELVDVVVSGLVLAFLSIFLLDLCFSARGAGPICSGCSDTNTRLEPYGSEDIGTIKPCSCVETMKSTYLHPAAFTRIPHAFDALQPFPDRVTNKSQAANQLDGYFHSHVRSGCATMDRKTAIPQSKITCTSTQVKNDYISEAHSPRRCTVVKSSLRPHTKCETNLDATGCSMFHMPEMSLRRPTFGNFTDVLTVSNPNCAAPSKPSGTREKEQYAAVNPSTQNVLAKSPPTLAATNRLHSPAGRNPNDFPSEAIAVPARSQTESVYTDQAFSTNSASTAETQSDHSVMSYRPCECVRILSAHYPSEVRCRPGCSCEMVSSTMNMPENCRASPTTPRVQELHTFVQLATPLGTETDVS